MTPWLLVPAALAAEPAPPVTPAPPAPSCDVAVAAVLDDETFRGHRMTPSLAATIEASSPEERALWDAESHGASYRLCTYEVVVNGARYRFVEDWDTTFDDKPADWCAQAKPEVVESIRRATAQCSDLHRGAWWGSDLVPLSAPAAE